MPQSLTQQTVNTFVGGLITEATELNSPENTSVDELNCELLDDGSRRRRRGIDLQSGGAASSFTVDDDFVNTTHTWDNVNKQGSLSFLVVQSGGWLYFYKKSSYPVSDNFYAFSFNMNTVTVGNGLSPKNFPTQTAVINGKLIVVNPAIDAIIIRYDEEDDTFTASTLSDPKIRDFEWQGDQTDYFKDVASPSDARIYDTYNVGWTQPPLSKYLNRFGQYPRLTHPWWTARDSSATSNFDSSGWRDVEFGTSLAANGHFILDLFNKDRRGALIEDKGVYVDIAKEITKTRFSVVQSFAGRVWFAGLGDNRIYFSKVVEDEDDITKFYQISDPTAEDINDLVDSDGGYINIPEAQNVKKLFVYGSSILVFAENGIWQVSGPDNVFKATEFYVTKISGIGLYSPRTFVDVEGAPFWWSRYGIFSIAQGEISQEPEVSNLSHNSIQSFFDDIPISNRLEVVGVYDKQERIIQWLYSTDASNPTHLDGVINLDITLKAFYPWKFSYSSPKVNYVIGASFFEGFGVDFEEEDVTADGVNVTENGVQVTATNTAVVTATTPRVVYLVKNTGDGFLYFADLKQDESKLTDWASEEDYDSYVEAAYNFMGDLTTDKRPIYLTTYLKRTETGWTGNETDGYELVNPSSCLVKTYWDLRTDVTNVPGQQIYRLKRLPIVDPGNLNSFPYEREVVISKTRFRGRGRVLKIRFESVDDNDWHIKGYEFIGAKNQSI